MYFWALRGRYHEHVSCQLSALGHNLKESEAATNTKLLPHAAPHVLSQVNVQI